MEEESETVLIYDEKSQERFEVRKGRNAEASCINYEVLSKFGYSVHLSGQRSQETDAESPSARFGIHYNPVSYKQNWERLYDVDDGMRAQDQDNWLEKFADQFKVKRCNVFVPRVDSKSECGCGYQRDKHHGLIGKAGEIWNSNQHTVKEPCTSYGYINSSLISFIRLADDTDHELVYDLVQEYWERENVVSPTCYVSVVGGNSKVPRSKNVKQSLKDLAKMALDVIFIDGGTRTFIHELTRSTLYAISFAPWGCLKDKEGLEGQKGKPFTMNVCSVNETSETVCLMERSQLVIMVDDGSQRKYGMERILRGKVEKDIAWKSKAPLVMLLICGGYSSVEMIWKGLNESPWVPVIVFKGSGGGADLLAEVLEAKQNLGADISKLVDSKIQQLLKNHNLNEKEILQYKKYVVDCIEQFNAFIYIFDADKEELSKTFVRALFYHPKWNTNDLEEQKFASTMVNVAEKFNEFVFMTELMPSLPFCGSVINKLFFDSLKNDNSRIVDVLLNNFAFSIETFLVNGTTLFDLYEGTDVSFTEYGQTLKVEDLRVVDKILRALLGERFKPLHNDISYDQKEINANQALLIYCLLARSNECSKILWRYDRAYYLPNAVLAFKISQQMKTEDLPRYFENAICSLLSCFNNERIHEMLPTETPSLEESLLEPVSCLGDQTPMDVILQENIVAVRKHPFFHKAFMKNEIRQNGKEDEKFFSRFLSCVRSTNFKILSSFLVYIIFLSLFAYMIMIKSSSDHDVLEWVIFVIVFGYAIDELWQVIVDYRGTSFELPEDIQNATFFEKVKRSKTRRKLQRWWSSPWNVLDFITLSLYYLAFILSFCTPYASKIVMAIDGFFWFVKISQFLRTFRTLGTYMVMICNMLYHMRTFMVMIIILTIAYGIFMHTLLFPSSLPSWEVLFAILFRPYLLLFGDLGVESDNLSGKQTVFGTAKVPLASELIVIFGMSFTVLLANVLLINLLIAVFSSVYEEVKEDSEAIWRYETQNLHREYQNKPIFPAPFSIFHNFCYIFWGHSTNPRIKQNRNISLLRLAEEWAVNRLDESNLDNKVKLSEEDREILERVKRSFKESVTAVDVKLSKSVTKNRECLINIGNMVIKLEQKQKRSLKSIEDSLKKIKLSLSKKT